MDRNTFYSIKVVKRSCSLPFCLCQLAIKMIHVNGTAAIKSPSSWQEEQKNFWRPKRGIQIARVRVLIHLFGGHFLLLSYVLTCTHYTHGIKVEVCSRICNVRKLSLFLTNHYFSQLILTPSSDTSITTTRRMHHEENWPWLLVNVHRWGIRQPTRKVEIFCKFFNCCSMLIESSSVEASATPPLHTVLA